MTHIHIGDETVAKDKTTDILESIYDAFQDQSLRNTVAILISDPNHGGIGDDIIEKVNNLSRLEIVALLSASGEFGRKIYNSTRAIEMLKWMAAAARNPEWFFKLRDTVCDRPVEDDDIDAAKMYSDHIFVCEEQHDDAA